MLRGSPELARNDPGILKLRFESGGVRDEDDESSRCQRPGRDRAPVAAVGSGPARECEGGNRPCSKPECQTARRKQENWRTRNPGYPVAWRIDQRATKDQIRPYRIPRRFRHTSPFSILGPGQPAMQLGFTNSTGGGSNCAFASRTVSAICWRRWLKTDSRPRRGGRAGDP